MEKFRLYGERARGLYVSGKNCPAIAKLLPVSVQSVRRWKRIYEWDKGIKEIPAHTPRAVDVLRKLLDSKIRGLDENMTAANVDEIVKITTSIERLEKGGVDLYGASLEIMNRYAEYLKQVLEPAALDAQVKLIRGFYEHIAEHG